jgi:hypothetical protein
MRLLRGAMNRLRSMPDAQAESAKDRCGSAALIDEWLFPESEASRAAFRQ